MSLQPWAENIRRKYIRNEANMFILHLNVYDRFLHDGVFYDVAEYLAKVVLWETKSKIIVYDPSAGLSYLKGQPPRAPELLGVGKRNIAEVLPQLEETLYSSNSTAVIIPYAATIAPEGTMSFMGAHDRSAVVTLHRWSLNTYLNTKDNIIFLIAESLPSLNPMLISNPKIAAVEVPLPDVETRRRVIRHFDPRISDDQARRLAEHTAGLQAVQISTLLSPEKSTNLGLTERRAYIRQLLADSPDAETRADKLAAMTDGMDQDEIRNLIRPEALASIESRPDPYAGVMQLVAHRKREIIEKECQGIIEFIDTKHDFSAVGGNEEIKKELLLIADNIKAGNKKRVPMGLLFVGPMGTGKTFIAGAFAKECGISAIRLKNFRSKWVGETESNLEKVISIVQAMGPIMLIIDEGDRSFGGTDSDDGTSSRVIARLKEFMSDTSNRGNVLFILMTNRPDKLDVDIKRAGRLDKKIPFFYPSTTEEVEQILQAQLRRYQVHHQLKWPRDRASTSLPLLDYSIADLEAVVLLANNMAEIRGQAVTAKLFAEAVKDFLPSRDTNMLRYMELLAVFESSSRRLLPKRYQDLTAEQLNEQLAELRHTIGER